MTQTQVLIWESNPFQGPFLQNLYAEAGFDAHLYAHYRGLRQALNKAADQISLVVIDFKPETPVSVIGALQKHAPLACVLVISSQQDLQSCLDLFQAGADAYLAKPLQQQQLLLQSQALLRHAQRVRQYHLQPKPATKLSMGPLTLHHASQTLELEGVTVRLSKREWVLMHHFCLHAGCLLKRHQLYELLWPDQLNVQSRQLDNLMLGLRHKLAFSDQIAIETHYGQGYLFRFTNPLKP